jgi:hypothetical protein
VIPWALALLAGNVALGLSKIESRTALRAAVCLAAVVLLAVRFSA